jgi:hypothetical protein
MSMQIAKGDWALNGGKYNHAKVRVDVGVEL